MNCKLWPHLGFGQAQVDLNQTAVVQLRQGLHSTWIYAHPDFFSDADTPEIFICLKC